MAAVESMAADWNDIKNHIISIMPDSKDNLLWNEMRYMIENFFLPRFFFALWTKSKKISFFVVCQWKIYGRWWEDVNEHNELVPSGTMEEIDHDRKYERFIVFFVTFLHIYQLFFFF